jgi:hypothetical protein
MASWRRFNKSELLDMMAAPCLPVLASGFDGRSVWVGAGFWF